MVKQLIAEKERKEEKEEKKEEPQVQAPLTQRMIAQDARLNNFAQSASASFSSSFFPGSITVGNDLKLKRDARDFSRHNFALYHDPRDNYMLMTSKPDILLHERTVLFCKPQGTYAVIANMSEKNKLDCKLVDNIKGKRFLSHAGRADFFEFPHQFCLVGQNRYKNTHLYLWAIKEIGLKQSEKDEANVGFVLK